MRTTRAIRTKTSSGGVSDADYLVRTAHGDLSAEILLSTVNQQGTYASRPAAGNAGYSYYATDIGVLFFDNGTSWVVVSDPWGFRFFEDEGFITSAMAVEIAGLTTVPTEDATILVAGGAWSITDALGTFTYGATTGVQAVGWDLSQTRTELLFVAFGNFYGPSMGIFTQDTGLAGSEIDNAFLWACRPNSGVYTLYEENVGFSSLEDTQSLDKVADVTNPFTGLALHVDLVNNTQKGFLRDGGGQWAEIASGTSASFSAHGTVGYRCSLSTGTNTVRMSCPVICMASG